MLQPSVKCIQVQSKRLADTACGTTGARVNCDSSSCTLGVRHKRAGLLVKSVQVPEMGFIEAG